MTEINEIIKREINPFDPISFKSTNFWHQKQNPELTVESIHKEAIIEIEDILDLVARDHRSRTVLLLGDSGSGKSYLLGRLKRTLNPKAFFVYILCNWADSNNIWRHILRHTVDSLIQIPEGEQESQLMLWLKSLSAFTKRNLKQRVFNDSIWQFLQSDRQKFVKHLKDTYKQDNIYNSDIFFGVLYELTNPELYDLACDWLRGDDISEESMQLLKVRSCIESEDIAKNILSNFGRISTETQPIVLCFDNLDTIPILPNGLIDIQPFFNVNTTIHNDYFKNFLVIISVITNTWRRISDRVQPADKAGIHHLIQLKYITLDQAEALWRYQLKPIHQMANPKPNSSIFPLNRQLLQQNFPGGKTMPKNTLILGYQEYKKYKTEIGGNVREPDEVDEEAEFKLLWQKEYKKSQEKFTKISLVSSPDLIRMLQEVLTALQVSAIKPKLLNGTYASYSFSFQRSGKQERIGIVWTEDSRMQSFFNIMNACQRAIHQNLCDILYLIRIGGVGTPRLAGNQIYQQIFTHSNHLHIKPNLNSIYYLATYQSLVNSVLAQELVLADQTISLKKLQGLIRDLQILDKCTLLQDIGIVAKQKPDDPPVPGKPDLRPVKDFLVNLVKTQSFMGVPTLIKNSVEQFPNVKANDVQLLIELLCQEKKVKIINPKAKLQDQLICLVA